MISAPKANHPDFLSILPTPAISPSGRPQTHFEGYLDTCTAIVRVEDPLGPAIPNCGDELLCKIQRWTMCTRGEQDVTISSSSLSGSKGKRFIGMTM